jgi:hypothetical protein
MWLSFLPTIPASRASKGSRATGCLVGGKRNEGMGGLSIAANWECYERLGCKVSGMLAWDVRYVVMCKGCPLSPAPTCAPARTEDKEGPSQPPPPPPRAKWEEGSQH